jgi:VanZ family protein
MKNMKCRNVIFLALMLIWMGVIFVFSQQGADDSTEESRTVGMAVGHIFEPDFDSWTKDEQIRYADRIEHPVRKTAHFIEFTILGVLITGFWYGHDRRSWLNVLVPYIVGTLYAASDETHQLFISGRSGQVSDVVLDSFGVLSGVLIMVLIMHLVYTKRINDNKQSTD